MNIKIIYYVYLLHKAINPLGRGKVSKFNTNVDDVYLNFHRKRLVLTLLEELSISKLTFFGYRHNSSHPPVQICTALPESQTLYKGIGEAVDMHTLCPAWPATSQLCKSTKLID